MNFHENFHANTRIYDEVFLMASGHDRKWLFFYFSNKVIKKLNMNFLIFFYYRVDDLIIKIWMIGIIILHVRSVHLRYLWISISKIQIMSFHKKKNLFKYSEYSKSSYEVAKEYSKRWRPIVLSYLHIVIEIMIHWDQSKYDRFLFN